MISQATRAALAAVLLALPAAPAAPPTRAQAERALRKAVAFFHGTVARHGGYVWRCSGDLALREGEGKAGPDVIWVQPPGTPAVGEAFLDAYEATGDPSALRAARDAAGALVRGQLHSGGWQYRIDFSDAGRRQSSYRRDPAGRVLADPTAPADRTTPGGWHVWRKRRYKANMALLDDDTTQAALRLLMRVDRALKRADADVHEAAEYGLRALMGAQYPNGAWSHNYDRFPHAPPSERDYPVRPASYPDAWPRGWPKAFAGCYMLNDNITPDAIRTLLWAWEVYADERYLAAARRGGRFLLLAQMPDPQPAWAQQYDRAMHPVWDRPFEPPAVSGYESQGVLDCLLALFRATGDRTFLQPVPRALAYLRRSLLPDGGLARFYELRTNRPIYFTRGRDGRHVMTYRREDLATHYGFVIPSRLDAIEAEYRRLAAIGPGTGALPIPPADEPPDPGLAEKVRKAIDALDSRGAWVRPGRLKAHKTQPRSGVIESATFLTNVRLLCRFLAP